VKDAPRRVTLVALGEGGALGVHSADGPITGHVISGEIRLKFGAKEWELGSGELLSLCAVDGFRAFPRTPASPAGRSALPDDSLIAPLTARHDLLDSIGLLPIVNLTVRWTRTPKDQSTPAGRMR
jgi:hypothetical protein